MINPNNPTGAVYSRKTLEGIVDIAGENKLPIISDDAYEMLVFDGGYTNLRTLHKDVPWSPATASPRTTSIRARVSDTSLSTEKGGAK